MKLSVTQVKALRLLAGTSKGWKGVRTTATSWGTVEVNANTAYSLVKLGLVRFEGGRYVQGHGLPGTSRGRTFYDPGYLVITDRGRETLAQADL